MSRETITNDLRAIVAEISGVEAGKVTEESTLADDLDLDSLDIVELIMTIEDKFDVSIADDEAEGVKAFGDAVTLVEQKLG